MVAIKAQVTLPFDAAGRPSSGGTSKQAWLLGCSTMGEAKAARAVAAVWAELLAGHPLATSHYAEFRQAVTARYGQRLRGCAGLEELRRLLKELRDNGDLSRLAVSQEAEATPVEQPAPRNAQLQRQQEPEQQQQEPEAQQQNQPQQAQQQQPQVSLCMKVNADGVPDASHPSKQWFLMAANTPAEAALARDLASAWRAVHGKGVREDSLLQGQEAQQRLSRVLPDVMRQVLEARTVLQLRECLRNLKNSSELERLAAQLDSDDTAEAPGTHRSAAVAGQAPAPAPVTVAAPAAAGAAVAQAAVVEAGAPAQDEDDGAAGNTYVISGTFSLRLTTNAEGWPGGSTNRHWSLLCYKSAEQLAAATDLGRVWRHMHCPSTEVEGASQDAQLYQRYSGQPGLVQRLREARTIRMLRAVLKDLRDSGHLDRIDGGSSGKEGADGSLADYGPASDEEQEGSEEEVEGRPLLPPQQEQPGVEIRVRLYATTDEAGVPSSDVPSGAISRQWLVLTSKSTVHGAVASELSRVWRHIHCVARKPEITRKDQELWQRYCGEPQVLQHLQGAQTIPQLRSVLRTLRDAGDLDRLGSTAGRTAATAGQQAGQASPLSPQLLPRQPQQPVAVADAGAEAPAAAEEALASAEQQVASAAAAAPAPPAARVLGTAGTAAVGAAAVAPDPAAAPLPPATPPAVGIYCVKLHARVDAAGMPDASQPSRQWALVRVPLDVEALAAQALARIWRAARGAAVKQKQLEAGREARERFEQVVPELVQQAQAAPGIFQLRACLQSLHESGQLRRAARLLNLSTATAVGELAAPAGTTAAAAMPASMPAAPLLEGPGGPKKQRGPAGGVATAAAAAGAEQPAAGTVPEQHSPAADRMEAEVLEQPAGVVRDGNAVPGLAGQTPNAALGTASPSGGFGMVQTGRRKRGPTTAADGSERGPPSKRLAAAAQPESACGTGQQQQQPGQWAAQQRQESGSAATTATPALAAIPGVPSELPTPAAAASGAAMFTCQGAAGAQGPAAEVGHGPSRSGQPMVELPAVARAARQPPAHAAPDPSASAGDQNASLPLRLLAACNNKRAQAAGLTPAVVSNYMAVLTGRCSEAQRREAIEWVGALLAQQKFEAVRVYMEGLARLWGL